MKTLTPGRLAAFLWIAFGAGLLLLITTVYAVQVNLFGLFGTMPSFEQLENPRSEVASEIYFSDGMLMGKYYRENRTPVEFEDISQNLVKALYATEDIRFDRHAGIDLKGIAAIGVYLVRGDNRGSSTLSQQLAKNLFDARGENYTGGLHRVNRKVGVGVDKFKEWITAIRIERAYTKKEILTMYLNTVDFGSNTKGILTASQTFFNTTPDRLTIEQASVLVGLLKAPTYYSPVRNPENSLRRRNTVIGQMRKYRFLSQAQADSLSQLPMELDYRAESHNEGLATYYRAYVQNALMAWCRENGHDLYADGLKIYTTLDSRMQAYAEKAMADHMKYQQAIFFEHWKGRNPWVDESMREIPNFVERVARKSDRYQSYKEAFDGNEDSIRYYMNKPVPMKVFSWNTPTLEIDTVLSPLDSIRYMKHFLHAGMMSMDPHTGEVKAWVGGINHRFFKYDHVRQGRRQPGSTFKAFVYAAAIDNGYTPCYEVVDLPVTFFMSDGNEYTPSNSDGAPTGDRMTLRQGLARSINTVSAGLIKKLSPQTVVSYARRLGIESPLDPVPALALGVSDVSVYEMVGAYSTFVNNGTWTEPFTLDRIEDKYGQLLKQFNPKKLEAISSETAYLMTHMLMGATREKGGTAMGLYRLGNTLNGNEVAAKTGTTQNYSDGWFMGMTKDLVTGVWVGGDERSIHFRNFQYGQGARMAMPIWSKYMDQVYADQSLGITKGPFPRPANLSVNLDCQPIEEQEAPAPAPNIYRPPTDDLGGI